MCVYSRGGNGLSKKEKKNHKHLKLNFVSMQSY